jgi:hypothetical protein
VQQGLEPDEKGSDETHGESPQRGSQQALAGQTGSGEAVEADQAQAGPLRDRERRRLLDRVGGREDEENDWEGDSERDGGRVVRPSAQLSATDGPALAGLDPEDVAVQLSASPAAAAVPSSVPTTTPGLGGWSSSATISAKPMIAP